MPTRRDLLKLSVVAAGGCLGVWPAASARAQAATSLAIVVAKASPIRELTQFELKKLYLGSLITDSSGERIIPFNQNPNAPDRVLFEDRVLGMTPEEVARYWIERKIRGQGGAPKAVSPADLLQKVVSRLEHSVAYVRADQVLPDVRVISIDGRVPGDGSYGLAS
jgi:hypothetical protein